MLIPGFTRPAQRQRVFGRGRHGRVVSFSANAGEAGAAPASGPTNPGAPLGVMAGSDGWLTYTNTIYPKLHLGGASTRTVAGQRHANGACQQSSSGVSKPGTGATFEEEIALNPATCAEKVISGSLDTSALAHA